ncbi:MAG TPA: response regulator [Candidatus Limnocylindrales bacterium]|nr:response regulator [Candidatus Limnocylindrales bacterium]
MAKHIPHRVLVVDDDGDVADVVSAILTDDGYAVSTLVDVSHDSLFATVGKLEPDCLLLDGSSQVEYGLSWADAAHLAARQRSVPTIMFTAHPIDVREAQDAQSERARAADFAFVLGKPFHIDELLAAVATACERSEPFNHSSVGDRARTAALVRRLGELGATDVRTSDQREWATFRPKDTDAIRQLYWWQAKGAYLVGSYDQDGSLTRIGQFYDLEDAIAAAVPNHPAHRPT